MFEVTNLGLGTTDYASIVGSATSQVGLGMNQANTIQTAVSYTIDVDNNATLYIANASVNGSAGGAGNLASAIYVAPTGALWLGQDQAMAVTGTVNIGNSLGQHATNGFVGIICDSDFVSLGCTINDAPLVGQSAVIIQGQEASDLEAEVGANVSLTAHPIIGIPPTAVGFTNAANATGCAGKNDGIQSLDAIDIFGNANFTFKNGTIQCIVGDGLYVAGGGTYGLPSITIDSTTIQNTDIGIYAQAGTITVSNTTINFNYIGVQQDTDGTDNAAIDLTGAGVGGNIVVCSSNAESSQGATNPGIDVYNTSTVNLAADDVAWDTSGPDYFSCDSAFASCTCNNAACTVTPGADGMDAVEDSTNLGGVTTTNNTLSTITCT